MNNRRETKRLESVAQMRHMEKIANGELEYKETVIKNQQSGWKDEFVLILVSAPVMLLIWSVFSDDPHIQDKVTRFFDLFGSMPMWYQILFVSVVASIYGIKGADIMKRK
jgi:hypothetical protein